MQASQYLLKSKKLQNNSPKFSPARINHPTPLPLKSRLFRAKIRVRRRQTSNSSPLLKNRSPPVRGAKRACRSQPRKTRSPGSSHHNNNNNNRSSPNNNSRRGSYYSRRKAIYKSPRRSTRTSRKTSRRTFLLKNWSSSN